MQTTTPLDTIILRLPGINTYHKQPYPSISPSLPTLNQSGKTVLIAGGSSGIGFAIARAFVQAGAAHVILLGRREAVAREAASQLAKEASPTTTVSARACDINDPSATAQLWACLRSEGIYIDVLVLNAASTGEVGKTIVQAGLASVWSAYEANVRTLLDLTGHFFAQTLPDGQPGRRRRYVINVSTSAIHDNDYQGPNLVYGATKNAGTMLMQMVARETDPEEVQVVSYYPGGVLTPLARQSGIDESFAQWDDERLPGQFAVWLASPEARFAHGRMLSCHWDVDELKGNELQEKIKSDQYFLRLGLIGV